MRLAAACILATFIACFQSAAAIEIPDTATVLPGYASRIDASRRILDGATDNLTGLWNYPEEQMVVAIRKSSEFNYQLIAVEAENEAIDCGTVIGYLTTTANKSKMRMWLYSVVDGDRLTSPVECVAELGDGSILIQKRRLKMHISVNLTRFLPSVFGGVRVYPQIKSTEITPGLHKIEDKKEILIF